VGRRDDGGQMGTSGRAVFVLMLTGMGYFCRTRFKKKSLLSILSQSPAISFRFRLGIDRNTTPSTAPDMLTILG